MAPERLLRASLQAFYSVRSERQLMEQINYNMLFRWFVGLGISRRTGSGCSAPMSLPSSSQPFCVIPRSRAFCRTSTFRSTALVEAWASLKSFRAKDGSDEPSAPGRNGERHFHNEKRSNETHASTTDPDARLYATEAPAHAAAISSTILMAVAAHHTRTLTCAQASI